MIRNSINDFSLDIVGSGLFQTDPSRYRLPKNSAEMEDLYPVDISITAGSLKVDVQIGLFALANCLVSLLAGRLFESRWHIDIGDGEYSLVGGYSNGKSALSICDPSSVVYETSCGPEVLIIFCALCLSDVHDLALKSNIDLRSWFSEFPILE